MQGFEVKIVPQNARFPALRIMVFRRVMAKKTEPIGPILWAIETAFLHGPMKGNLLTKPENHNYLPYYIDMMNASVSAKYI